jgi:hypothetical protein
MRFIVNVPKKYVFESNYEVLPIPLLAVITLWNAAVKVFLARHLFISPFTVLPHKRELVIMIFVHEGIVPALPKCKVSGTKCGFDVKS